FALQAFVEIEQGGNQSCLEATKYNLEPLCTHPWGRFQWLRNPGPQHEKRTLFGDVVCFLFITPLATISGWLCLRGAVDHLHFSSRLEAVGLIALTVALFTIYLFWTLVSFRYHCRLYYEWRRTNQRVILLIPKSVNIPTNQQSLLGLQSLKRNSKETIV
ncbi:PREDICTED: E3 ubiquitin-protein ligase MARCH3-like, partial [Leptosomus discolor]|uniref:E3 ubiquitin-protein ligase MARCH3-like n=1 Tax=Leptosomus discolor TaxID=188344 RepID=UPI000522CA6C